MSEPSTARVGMGDRYRKCGFWGTSDPRRLNRIGRTVFSETSRRHLGRPPNASRRPPALGGKIDSGARFPAAVILNRFTDQPPRFLTTRRHFGHPLRVSHRPPALRGEVDNGSAVFGTGPPHRVYRIGRPVFENPPPPFFATRQG